MINKIKLKINKIYNLIKNRLFGKLCECNNKRKKKNGKKN